MAKTKTKEAPEATVPEFEIEILDELPKISRANDSGVWTERLQPAVDNQGKWVKVWATGDRSPHPTVNALRSGKAGGINPDDFEFAGRTVNGEGFVFVRYLTDAQKQAEAEAANA